MTKDIDITLGVDAGELPRILGIVNDLGLVVIPSDASEFVRRTMVLPLRDESTGILVDFIFSFSEYERQAIERSRAVRISRVDVHYATLEDILVHKIVAGRPRDMEDVRTLILKNPNGDWGYVRRWLNDFDTALAANYIATFDQVLDETLPP